ncbi:hypothetical protein [Thalassotalea ganghwensis]
MKNKSNRNGLLVIVYSIMYAVGILWVSYLIKGHPESQTVMLIMICLSTVPLTLLGRKDEQHCKRKE